MCCGEAEAVVGWGAMKVTWSLALLTLNIALALGDPAASVVVVLPEGATALWSASGDSRPLTSGTPLMLDAGEGELTVVHDDYEPYARHLTLESGRGLIVIPRLRPSDSYRQSQQKSLLKQRERLQTQRDAVVLSSFGVGALALAGWATVGGLEWTLASRKSALVDSHAAYRAASSDQAAQVWSSIEALKTEIATLRTYETYALAGSGGLSVGALALWLLGPVGTLDEGLSVPE